MAGGDLLKGVTSKIVDTARLRMHVLSSGASGGTPVFFVHGNVSSSRFFEETLAALSSHAWYRWLAPDLRGFGDSETKRIDATRGLGDLSDDLHALADALRVRGQQIHLIGWSMGGSLIMRYALDHPYEVASLILINPMSPYGFGGTKDASGTPCWADYAGSGGRLVNPEFVQRLKQGDRSDRDPNAPRNVMNSVYFKPPFRAGKEREEVLLSAMLSTKVVEGNYPGNSTPSNNWPHFAPGTTGINNAISPKYCNLKAFVNIDPKPPVLWIRGANDTIVSNTSLQDLGYLGQQGKVPKWPGIEVYPPQPMVSQMRTMLTAYVRNGGCCHEKVIEECGHSPHVEKPVAFRNILLGFLDKQSNHPK
jgi:pimeloyl-ACP methyl ester carboxylesterase